MLIGVEVALAFVLLSGAGLLLRTLWTMQHVDRGFRRIAIATMRLSLPGALYAGPPEVQRVLLAAARQGARASRRGIGGDGQRRSAAAARQLGRLHHRRPACPATRRTDRISDRDRVARVFRDTRRDAAVGPDVHRPRITPSAPLVVVINETFARMGWPGQDPLGRRIRGGGANSRAPWLTVVGVVRDLRRADLRREIPAGDLFLHAAAPLAQPDAADPHRRRPGVDRRRRPARGADPQPAAAAVRRRHAGGPGRGNTDARSLRRGAARDVRAGGGAAGQRRDLRRHRARRRPAHARSRHPHGARRRGAPTCCG